MERTRYLLAGALFLLAACTREAPAPAAPPAEAPVPVEAEAAYVNDVAGFSLDLPDAWEGLYLVDELEGDEAAAYQGARQAVEFRYTPEDAALDEQPLLTLLVYDRDDWASLAQAEGSPAGFPVGENEAAVYAVLLPRSNPYDGASPDAQRYEELVLTLDDVRQIFSVR